jgi:hypothetical protein
MGASSGAGRLLPCAVALSVHEAILPEAVCMTTTLPLAVTTLCEKLIKLLCPWSIDVVSVSLTAYGTGKHHGKQQDRAWGGHHTHTGFIPLL